MVLVVGVLGKRVRDNGGVGKVLKKVRSRGIWHIDGRDQSSSTGPNTQDTTELDRRSSSPECVADSFSQADKRGYYMWQPIKVSVDGEEAGSVAVIGERGKDLRRWTPLHCETVRFSGDSTLQDILMRDHGQLDAQGPGGFTPLMIAIVSQEKKNRHKLITVRTDSSSSSSDQSERDILMTNCAPPYSHPGGVDGMMLPAHYPGHHPPHLAHYSPVGIFVSHRANVNITNDYGQTALHLAAKHGREDYIHILLSVKADPNIQDVWGQTALHVAIGAATPGAFKVRVLYILVYSCISLDILVDFCLIYIPIFAFLYHVLYNLVRFCIFLCIIVHSCISSGFISLFKDKYGAKEHGRSDPTDNVCQDG